MRATARPYPRLGTFARKEEAAIVTIPLESVEFRTGAVPDRDRVAVLDEAATKTNRKESGMQSRGGAGLDLETALAVQVRVRPAGGPSYCWMDVHVFDRMDDLITSETLPLQYVRSDDDADTEVYGFDADIFRARAPRRARSGWRPTPGGSSTASITRPTAWSSATAFFASTSSSPTSP